MLVNHGNEIGILFSELHREVYMEMSAHCVSFKSRVIVWFLSTKCLIIGKLSREIQQKSPVKVSFKYIVYLLRKQQQPATPQKSHSIVNQEHQIHSRLAGTIPKQTP